MKPAIAGARRWSKSPSSPPDISNTKHYERRFLLPIVPLPNEDTRQGLHILPRLLFWWSRLQPATATSVAASPLGSRGPIKRVILSASEGSAFAARSCDAYRECGDVFTPPSLRLLPRLLFAVERASAGNGHVSRR